MRRLDPWHGAFAAFALGLFLFLAVRASDPDRWSDWHFGDAQTMLSLRQWNDGGWIANYLLFVPQGYAKVVSLLDEPGLRQHGHGIAPGPARSVGPRLRYTHYPAGYLVPYAVLYRWGLDSLPAARLLSCLFSVGALGLFYLLLGRLTTPAVALVSAVFYGLSPVFLGYADSIANQPLDDLLRFGFLLAIVLSTEAASRRGERALLAMAWAAEFLLSLSSFDSVFFVYAWLIGWDVLQGRGFRWRRYLLFALAPLTAHGLQYLQNVWYLGARDAWADLSGVFLEIGMPGGRLYVTLRSLRKIALNAQWQPLLWLLGGLVYAGVRVFKRPEPSRHLPSLGLLALLGGCGLLYVALLPVRAEMTYQGRQFLPALSLLAGALTAFAARGVAGLLPRAGVEPRPSRFIGLSWTLAAAVAAIALWTQLAMADREPTANPPATNPDAQFAKELRSFRTAREPVYLSIDGFQDLYNARYVSGYPQVNPLQEYYVGSRPILCFDNADLLVNDLAELARRAPGAFSPVLVSVKRDLLFEAFSKLNSRGMLRAGKLAVYQAGGYQYIDLTTLLK